MKFREEPGLMNKNFDYGEKVVIVNTTDKFMDNIEATIVGKPIIGMCDFYIIDVEKQIYPDKPDTCFLMTEACLERI